MLKLPSDRYSPTRLITNPTTQYDFPGDRFIPNRSLMDLDQAHSLLTSRIKKTCNPTNFNEVYRQKVEEKLSLDSEGRPFRMLVFRGSPKSSRRSVRLIDEMRREELEALDNSTKQCQLRHFPKKEARILDAPNIVNDFYMNIMDWGRNNVLAVALGSELYLWKSDNGNVQRLLQVGANDYPSSVAWSEDAKTLAIGYLHSNLQLWDAETSKLVRSLEGHTGRVAATGWNGQILTSGSQDKSIINHDVRATNNMTSRIQVHTEEVCSLKWSSRGNILATGGNENLIYIWESSKMSSSNFLHRFNEHSAAVKSLAWCPYQSDVLASGGGTKDGCIKIWNTQKGTCISSLDTKAQVPMKVDLGWKGNRLVDLLPSVRSKVCGLEWNRHHKEIMSGHGFSASENRNLLCLWRYPSMTKVGEFRRHASRILHLSQSPDGLTVASAGADETLRFWDVFGPPSTDNSRISELEGLLSLKTSPIR